MSLRDVRIDFDPDRGEPYRIFVGPAGMKFGALVSTHLRRDEVFRALVAMGVPAELAAKQIREFVAAASLVEFQCELPG